MLMEGSASLDAFRPLRESYGTLHDSCGGDIDTPYLASDPADLLPDDPRARWVSGGPGGYRAGDAVIFSKFCIHGSTVNTSEDGVRLSSDVRFQVRCQPRPRACFAAGTAACVDTARVRL